MTSSPDQRATKIVATIGTASSTPEQLLELMQAGVNVFRLNFSHGTQQEQAERIRAIRGLEDVTGRPTCILADLQGPKHRIGKMAEGVELAAGDSFTFDQSAETGDGARVGLPHPEIFSALTPALMPTPKLHRHDPMLATAPKPTPCSRAPIGWNPEWNRPSV